ncbi:MAG TPA: hypothetical protein VFX97_16005 [Pyrinomonadaceae bacterium]|nr:hypothetical protein [Pyrinomonadaceae bacterium]
MNMLAHTIQIWSQLLLALLVFSVYAENTKVLSKVPSQQSKDQKPTPSRSVEIETFVSAARTIPSEFAASLLYRIAQSEKVTDRQWKKELLEEAFLFSEKAQADVRRKVIPFPGVSVDTDSGYRSYAFDLEIDRLSLRSRIVRAMLPLDKQRARELLSQMSPNLKLAPLDCSDAMVYEVATFYESLIAVAERGFSTDEIESGVRAEYIVPYVRAITAPAQVGPVIELLLRFKTSPREHYFLVRAFGDALKKISGDDRSFSYSISRQPISRGILQLARVQYQHENQSEDLLKAYRTYLVGNLTAARCVDNAAFDEQAAPSYISDANFLFDNKLSRDELKPAETKAGPKFLKYWETDEARAMLRKSKELSWGPEGESVSDSEKQSAAWQQRVQDYLSQLESWSGSQESSELAVFHQKCVLYAGLLGRVPEGPLKENIFRRYQQYLTSSSIKEESRIDWFLHVSGLLSRPELAGKKNTWLSILTESTNTTIRLNAKAKYLQL